MRHFASLLDLSSKSMTFRPWLKYQKIRHAAVANQMARKARILPAQERKTNGYILSARFPF